MLDIESILLMWKEDAVIDEMQLDESSRSTPQLHAKYLELLTVSKLQLKKRELQFKVLLKDKWLYYNSKLSKDEIDERGWEYDPFNGLTKPLKGDMDYYYDADTDIQKAQAGIEQLKVIIDTLKEIMENLKWKHQTIKNMIEWRKFTSGA